MKLFYKKSFLKKWIGTTIIIVLLSVLFISPNIVNNVWGNSTLDNSDKSVKNISSYATDVVYQIVTDRFQDGNTKNNPLSPLYDKCNLKKYHGGDWAGITQKLQDGYLKNMGVSAIWISSPVENIQSIDPSNGCAAYHGYWAKDFFKTNPYFGTESDFVNMIQMAHYQGIKVIIDFAPNHTSTAEFGGVLFPEDGRLYKNGSLVSGFKEDRLGIFNHENWTDFSSYENCIYHSMYGLADLNHMNPAIDLYMKEAIDKWLDLGIDGIRVDAVKHMEPGWQTNWVSHIYSKKPVFIFGEWYNGGVEQDKQMTEFANNSGMNLLDFRYANAIRNTIGSNVSSMKSLDKVTEETKSDYKDVNAQVTFIDNHDMSRFMTLAGNDKRKLENAYVLLLTSRGIPAIYYGSEQYMQGNTDPENRKDMTTFNQNSIAYKVIETLAPLRKKNPALAYGSTQQRWMNDDVYIYEREFNGNIVVTAINRNSKKECLIHDLYTKLPEGKYSDVLKKILDGNDIQVSSNGRISDFTLKPGASSVWEFTKEAKVENASIGEISPRKGIAGDKVTITGQGFGNNGGTVWFNNIKANIDQWSDSKIVVIVPNIKGEKAKIHVETSTKGKCDFASELEILSGKQIPIRFILNQATTTYGTNIYVVGNIEELGNWDTNKAIGPFFNDTSTIAKYPNWFYDVSLPENKDIEYKFIKKDSTGKVIWEGGSNHHIFSKEQNNIVKTTWQQ